MKKILFLLISFVFFNRSYSQDLLPISVDSTGNVYVVFMRNDSIGVIYQGKNTFFTTDGSFAKNASAFELKLKGFSPFNKIYKNLSDVPTEKPPVVIPEEPENGENQVTNVFSKLDSYGYSNPSYIIENDTWSKIKQSPKNIVGMQGYDFSPITANKLSQYKYGDWRQKYISISGKKTVWTEGINTYYLKPKGYYTDTSTNLMDFDLRFPDFTPPAGRIVVMQPTPLREIGVANYLKKGVTHSKVLDNSSGYSFVSDAWLLDLGCPVAYTSTQEDMDKWCRDIDETVLLSSFINNVYYPNRFKGYVMLNWEAVGDRWKVRQDKIIKCLQYWHDNPHSAKMSLWTVSGIGIGRPKIQGDNIDYSFLLEFNGTLDEFSRTYSNYVSVDFTYAKYVEVAHIGGYQNYPIDDGVIHHYLINLLLHKKYNKEKEIVGTFWFDQEFIDNFELGWVRVENGNQDYLAQVKPKVPPSIAFAWGVFSTAIGDGLDCWSDPNFWIEDKKYWGWGSKDLLGKDLPNYFGPNVSKYPSQPMKNVDWMMSGVWAVSQNKDIVECDSEWKFVDLPSKSYYERKPVICYKMSQDKKELLILAYDGFCEADEVKSHTLDLGFTQIPVKTHGRFTSVIRHKLQ